MRIETDILIRPLLKTDQPALWRMSYHAIHVPEGFPPLPEEVVRQPAFSKYVSQWGRPGDSGFAAVSSADHQLLGAAWFRLFDRQDPGYGFVSEDVPELSIALLPSSRGRGIGGRLMTRLLQDAARHFDAISLSVDPDNWAMAWYGRLGFEETAQSGGSIVMLKSLSPPVT